VKSVATYNLIKMKVYFSYIFLFLLLSLNSCAQKSDTSKEVKIDYKLPEISDSIEMPEFPGGVEAMKKYISENVHYPDSAKNESLQGKCFVKFIINPDGSISNVSVLKGVPRCTECDTEAVRVVRAMPRWKPGRVNKKTAPVYFNLPIIFKMQ